MLRASGVKKAMKRQKSEEIHQAKGARLASDVSTLRSVGKEGGGLLQKGAAVLRPYKRADGSYFRLNRRYKAQGHKVPASPRQACP